MSMTNCLIAGVGGQGTVLASKLIATAAMDIGLAVRTTETIGMAQRGGCVVSHVRMGEGIFSPLIPLRSADLILALEPAEAVRLLPYLAEGGLLIACDAALKPVTDALGKGGYQARAVLDFLAAQPIDSLILSGEKLTAGCGPKALNVAMLGAAAQSGRLPMGAEALETVIQAKIPQRFQAMNLEAFESGRSMYNEQRSTGR